MTAALKKLYRVIKKKDIYHVQEKTLGVVYIAWETVRRFKSKERADQELKSLIGALRH